jgi:ribose 5-phosphate isomerase B
VHDVTTARLCREHNDANVLALGERVTGAIQAIDCVQVFLDTPFAGGRHQRRIDKLSAPKLKS